MVNLNLVKIAKKLLLFKFNLSSNGTGCSEFYLATILTTVPEFQGEIWHNLRERRKRQSCQDNNKRWMNEWVNIKTTVSRHLCQLKLSYAQGCRKRTLTSQWLTTPKVYFLLTLHVHKGQLHPFFIL